MTLATLGGAQPKKAALKKHAAAIPVTVARVKRSVVDRYIRVKGDATPLRQVAVTPLIKGKIIQKITVDVGDRVPQARFVVAVLRRDTIDPQIRQVKAQIEATKHQIAGARSALRQGLADLNRYRQLARRDVSSRQQMEQQRAKVDGQKAQLGSLQANQKNLEAKLQELEWLSKWHLVRAQVKGLVVKRDVDPGAVSDDKTPIVHLVVDDPMKVMIYLGQDEVARVKKGMRVRFDNVGCPGGRYLVGTVARVYPIIDVATRTGTIEVHVPNHTACLRTGTFLRGRIIIGRKKALLVPIEALVRFPGTAQYYVFAVADGRVRRVNVSVGRIYGAWQVVRGLEVGRVVVTSGQGRLATGRPVKVVSGGRP
ncbi:MAG: efflux RND transporter periplasmic adaptor subunit [Proteobacteria bacterium]|nr:efflux RND transporter periplasmic adaptor subunit [Pseudomonadota bacterium]